MSKLTDFVSLDLGNEHFVDKKNIVMICDIERITRRESGKEYFNSVMKRNKIVDCCNFKIPNTLVICMENGCEVDYLSHLTVNNLRKYQIF